jgi:hypothetical protein
MFCVNNTLFPEEVENSVYSAYDNRQVNDSLPQNEMIEVTCKVKVEIEAMLFSKNEFDWNYLISQLKGEYFLC